MQEQASITTFLFTDIEGSTRLWEQDPERMRPALARHDAIARSAVEDHRGIIVKMTGDGIHAAFDDPLDAINATLQMQRALADSAGHGGISLLVRCGLHAGVYERRDNDFFGAAVNRAARIMSAAHGGQMLLSKAVAALVEKRLPAGVALKDVGAVRLRDLADPEHVFQIVHPGLRTEFPALRSMENTPNNLPQELSSFIGRARELVEAGALMTKNRLVTVLGMGGLGKTRLALQLAAGELGNYPDGVWFVELAPLSDPRLVPQAVATSLNVKEEAGRPVLEALTKYVKDRTLLLVLDNCEHLLQACAGLSKQLLSSAPRLRILTSSREALRIPGETTFLLPPLPVPSLRVPFEPLVLEQFEAAQLFIDRATAARPDFKVTPQNASAIAAICHRLDGIPLALELAAARVATLSVETLADRLKDRFKLLKSGDLTVLPRQQTLRALIDWSYDLLSDTERALLQQLSIFAGGWTLEAAEAVCACDDDPVIDLLSRLVEKSLVVHDANTGRYRLLETVREYASERLNASADADSAGARHLDFFTEFAARSQSGLTGLVPGESLLSLDLELENILSAHEWAGHSPQDAQRGLQLANCVKRYWLNRGLLELGLRVTLEALARPGASPRDIARCHGLFTVGQLHHAMGKYREARKCLEESLEIARELGEDKSIIAILQSLGMAAQGEGDVAIARIHLEEALTLAERSGDKRRIAAAMNALAQFECADGKFDVAEPLFENVVALSRETGNREVVAIGLLNLTIVSISRRSMERSCELLREVLAMTEDIGSSHVEQSLLEVAAGLAAQGDDAGKAARFYGAAEAQARKTGLRRDPSDEAFLAPLMEKARDILGAAEFDATVAAGCELSPQHAAAEVREWLQKSG